MTNSEKAAYIRGLMKGMELDPNAKETKIFEAVIDLLESLCATVDDLDNEVMQLSDELEEMDMDIEDMAEEIYPHNHKGCNHDEDIFMVTCPGCKEEISLTDEMLERDSIHCPSCGELLEFEFDDDSCQCGDCK